jgi:hypothetical protein
MAETIIQRSADDYLRRALDCRELSERTPNRAKEDWLKIANDWDRLAGIAQRNAQ